MDFCAKIDLNKNKILFHHSSHHPSHHPSHHSKGGFSLIELIFAMFFLSIIVFGVVSLQSSNLAMVNSQNKEIQAHFYANQGAVIVEVLGAPVIDTQVEKILADGGCDGTLPCNLFLDTGGNSYAFKVGEEWLESSFFLRTIKVGNIDPPTSGVYKISAIVSWTDSTGDHSVNAKRIIYQ